MNVASPCEIAKEYLEDSEVEPINTYSPLRSASFYIPARKIKALFEDEPYGLTAESLFLCPCARCISDGGSVEYRSECFICFNKLKQRELEGEYAVIYALLIYVRRPGLIQKFQKHEIKLEGTRYLCDADFDKLHREGISDLGLAQRKILQHQYSFLVRTLRPSSDIISIPAKELLPIKEDVELKGEGTFTEVRCFEFQDDVYRSRDFGEHITRFARKIFKHGMQKSAAKEWYNLQRLSKEEDHPHLMVALGAYWHGSYFFILQEEAEQSLHDYLKEPGDKFESRELWTQMQGIAEGLSTLHKLYKGTKIAYHQDLKPANILIVNRKFKITDFGLLELKPVILPGDTDMTGVTNDHVTGFYAAPRQGKYTRDCDIWSLGCIMSEVATCDIQGPQGVGNYKKARMADGAPGRDTPRFFRGYQVKGAVLHMHAQLYNHVQSAISTDGNQTMQFQRGFYSKKFFELLNRMFRQYSITADSTHILGEGVAPAAAQVVDELDLLRKEALPTTMLVHEVEQRPQYPESLVSLMEAHLEGFGKTLSKKNREEFPGTTASILKRYIVKLQHKQHEERRQLGLVRLKQFLEGFDQFYELIRTLPSVGKIMGFIWGPVKFLLEVCSVPSAKAHNKHEEQTTHIYTEAFKDILDIYEQIGRAVPSLSMYKELFKDESDLEKVMIATYSDIIQANQLLVIYFQRRFWTELFATTWQRHKSRLTGILSRMASRFKLVLNRARLEQFDSFMATSLVEEEASVAAVHSENLGRQQAVHAWIKSTDMENDQEYLRRIRVAYPGTCSWLLNDPTFQKWFDKQSDTQAIRRLLWLNGKPGSGKTVLASLVVEEAKKLESRPTILIFYFKQDDRERDNFLSMARALLAQILKQNPHILDYFYSKCCSSRGPVLNSRRDVEDLLSFAIRNCESAYIVLDGLDECYTKKERGEIVSWFRNLIENDPLEVHNGLHCMFISQQDSARKDYRDILSITADAGRNEEDIETFCKVRAENLVTKLQITVDKAYEIAKRVSAAAEGVFLFAYLVWINLSGHSSIYSLEHEIETLVTNENPLNKAYACIMQNIMDKPVISQRDEALLLLGCFVFAKRSLKIHEVQTLMSIDFDNEVQKAESRESIVHVENLCGSLVDVREDGSIDFVHVTAKTFLKKSYFSDASNGELRMATLCMNYFNLPSFQTHSGDQVMAGEYGFMEYAILYWFRHLEAGMIAAPSSEDDTYRSLTKSLEVLIERYWNKPSVSVASISKSISKGTRDLLQHFSHCRSFPQIQLAIALTDKELKSSGDVHHEESVLKIASVVQTVRRRIETYAMHSSNTDVVESLRDVYGRNLFKCPRFSCRYFTDGFSTPEEREEHVKRHELPARCTVEHCRSSRIGFATQAQLKKHIKKNHPDMMERDHIFPTDEEINDSIRGMSLEPKVALELNSNPRSKFPVNEMSDISMGEASLKPKALIKDEHVSEEINFGKRKAFPAPDAAFKQDSKRRQTVSTEEKFSISMWEASQKAEGPVKDGPERDQINVSNRKASPESEAASEAASEYKTKRQGLKQEYRCAHCERNFSQKSDQESHMTIHDDNQRLQCPYCDKVCAGQKDLARHEEFHDTESATTCSGVRPDGRRWGCGMYFARHDELLTHHKSGKGRQCLQERDSDDSITASTCVRLDEPDSDSSSGRTGYQGESILIKAKEEISLIVRSILETEEDEESAIAHMKCLSFDIDWDPRGFLDEQNYDTTISTALERAITITGTYENAQALTCMEYMAKVWPETGQDTILALQAAVAQQSGKEPFDYTRLDGTELTISFQSSTVLVQAYGVVAALTELCEQLAWLGSAFRMAPTLTGPCLVYPRIQKSLMQTVQRSRSLWLALSFTTFPAGNKDFAKADNSECWHRLFRNPTIAHGFPIDARQHEQKGLEVSLDVLYTLAETRYATRYEDTLLLKGHCTLLVPTQRVGHSFVWHLLCSDDGKRIPYYRFREQCSDWLHLNDLELGELDTEHARHFVGWTSHIDRYLGTETIAYEKISYAGQRPCKSGLALEQKITVSVSRIVGVSGSVVRGNRDKPEYFKYSALSQQMESARGWFIVLYDSSTQRGWLTDGTSALLHMVRTQLARTPYDVCGQGFTNKHVKTSDFAHPRRDAGPDAAFDALMNENNQKYIVSRDFDSWSEEKVEPSRSQVLPADIESAATSSTGGSADGRKEVYKTTCFKQVVAQTYGVLEVIYDREREMASSHAIKEWRSPLGTSLEGWEFMDFVSYKQTLTRRYLPLRSSGLAWVDMMQRAHGIVLFGKNFGDLYEPAESVQQQVCSTWKNVPRDRELLAAPVSLIRKLQQLSFEDGEVDEGSNEIVKDIFWYPSTHMLSRCMPECRHSSLQRVQQLSRKCLKGSGQSKLEDLPEGSAVIFGGSSVFNGQPVGQPTTRSLSIRESSSSTHQSSNVSLSATSAAESDSASQSSQSSQSASHPSTTLPDLRQTTEAQSYDGANDDGILALSTRDIGDQVPSNGKKRKDQNEHQTQERARSFRKRFTSFRHDS